MQVEFEVVPEPLLNHIDYSKTMTEEVYSGGSLEEKGDATVNMNGAYAAVFNGLGGHPMGSIDKSLPMTCRSNLT